MEKSFEKNIARNVIFIALDSATKWIVDKLMDAGELPNLASLIHHGAYFNMDSGDLVMSPVVWTSIATGKVPRKHGVKSFFATANTVMTKRIWDIFEDRGHSVGIMGYFLTWPPRKVNGFMIPSLLAIDDQTWPPEYRFLHQLTVERKTNKKTSLPELIKQALTAYKYGVNIQTLIAGASESIRSRMIKRDFRDEVYRARILKQRLFCDVFIDLHKKYRPDFAAFHNHLIDTTSHDYWRYLQPEKFSNVSKDEIEKYGDRIYDAYRKADKTLGRILKLRGEDTLFIVASDHGAKSMAESPEIGHTPLMNAEKLMQALGIEGEISYSCVSYFIIVKPRIESENEKNRLKELFSSIRIMGQNLPLFNLYAYDEDNIWLRVNNQIQSLKGIEIFLNGEKFLVEEFVRMAENKASGTHDGKTAILVLNGPGVKKGITPEEPVDVVSVIPTLLALMNMPIGRDMDGRVLAEAIEPWFLDRFPLQFIDTHDSLSYGDDKGMEMIVSEELKNQLKALGYL